MKRTIRLSDSEWKIMRLLWENSPQTIMQLTAALREETGWSKNVVITMLSRLEAKGAVAYEQGERAKQYYPAMDREKATAGETESFLDKVFDGSVGLMVNTMVRDKGLSKEEIAELYAILGKAERGEI